MDKIYIVMDYVEHDLKCLMEHIMKAPFTIGKTIILFKVVFYTLKLKQRYFRSSENNNATVASRSATHAR